MIKILRYLIAIVFFVTALQGVNAQIIASEDFNYTVGSTIGGANGGTGWAGPWTIITGNNKSIIADSIKNFRTGKATGTVLDANYPPTSGSVRMERELATPITDNGNTYWFGVDAVYEGTAGNNANVVALVNTAATAATGPNGQLVLIGKQPASTGTGFLGLGTAPSTAVVTQKKKIQDTYWMVVKVKFSGDAAADTVYLFLNPDPAVEPVNSKADVVYTVATGLNGGFNGIYVKVEGTPTGLRAKYDNMILGNTYSDIIPTAVNSLPKYRQVREKFNYAANATLVGSGTATDGWNEPWTSVVAPVGSQTIVASRVENEPLLKQTMPNALSMSLISETRIKRNLKEIYRDNGLTYWLGFFAKFTNAANGNAMNVMLVNNGVETMAATGANGQLVAIGKVSANDQLGLGRPPSFFAPGISGVANRGNWFVAKIETNGTTAVDTVRLYLNPNPGTEPAPGTEVMKYAADKLNNGFRAIGLKITGTPTNLQALIDDLYLGLAYDEIVPEDLAVLDNAPDPAFEKFSYANNTPLNTTTPLGTKTGGWNGPWKSLVSEATVAADSVRNFHNLRSTASNALVIDRNTSDEVRLYRGLKTAYRDNTRTYWLGFWYRTNQFTSGELFQLSLGDTTTFSTTGEAGQLLRVGTTADNKNLKLFANPQTVDTGIAGDTARWIVLKIETNGTAAADTVRLFVDLPPNATTPPTNAMALRKIGTTMLNGGWNGILIRAGGSTSTLRAVLDDIYIGNTFAEIVPTGLTTLIPLDQPEVVHEPFNYTPSENLAGKGNATAGWGGSWLKVSGDDVLLETGSIETPLAVFEGNRSNINYTSTPAIYDRKLKTVFKDNGSSYWLSFLMDFANVQKISSEGQLVLMKGNTELIGFGRTSGFNRIGFTWGPDVFEFISNVPSAGKHWIVVRIDMSNNADAEGIYMWVDPIPEFQPSNSTASTFTNLTTEKKRALNDGFDGLRIKTAGSAPFQMFVDEIRIGNTYSDVSKIEEEIPDNLIAREQFRYGTGSAIQTLGTAGSQWGGPWREGFDGGGTTTVQEGSLSNGTRLATNGNHILLNHNTAVKNRPERDFAQFYEDDGSEHWLSFLADFSSTSNSNVAFLFFTNYRNYSGDNAQRLGIGKAFNSANIGILGKPASPINSTTPIRDGGIKWYVAKIQLTGNADPDTVWLWVNPNPEVVPDEAAPTMKITTTALNEGFQGIMVKAESSPAVATQFKVDEIRFGSTYESVAEINDGDIITSIEENDETDYLIGNYPNPFSTETTFEFQLPEAGHVRLAIFDLNGRELTSVVNQVLPAGKHTTTWNGRSDTGSALSGGLYVYRLTHQNRVVTKKLVVNR
jgi:hypothetical protein